MAGKAQTDYIASKFFVRPSPFDSSTELTAGRLRAGGADVENLIINISVNLYRSAPNRESQKIGCGLAHLKIEN